MLVTCIFSFSSNVFKSHVSMGRQKVSLCGNGFTLFRRQILYSSKLKDLADDNFKFNEKGRKHYGKILDSTKLRDFADDNFKFNEKGRKHCGKRRNCSFRAISRFPTVFSKDLYCRAGLVWERFMTSSDLKHLHATKYTDGSVQHYPKCLYKVYALGIVLHSPIHM